VCYLHVTVGAHHVTVGAHHVTVGAHHVTVGTHHVTFGTHHVTVGTHHVTVGTHLNDVQVASLASATAPQSQTSHFRNAQTDMHKILI